MLYPAPTSLCPLPGYIDAPVFTDGKDGRTWVAGREFESRVHHEIALKRKAGFLIDVKNLKKASGSPEIGTACGGGTSSRKIRPVPGEESVMRLRLGRRSVNLLPLAQRTKTFTPP